MNGDFGSPRLSALIRRRSRSAASRRQASALAELAVAISDRIDRGRFGAAVATRARVESWLHLSRIRSFTGDFAGSLSAIRVAEAIGHLEGRDPLLAASILVARSELEERRVCLVESIELTHRAVLLFARYGNDRDRSRGEARLGRLLVLTGRHEEAAPILRHALAGTDPTGDSIRALEIVGSLVPALLATGEGSGCLKILHRARGWLGTVSSPNEALTAGLELSRLEGLAAIALGRPREAEIVMTEAQKGFAAQGRIRASAGALFDLAKLHARRSEGDKLAALGDQVPSLLLAQGEKGGLAFDGLAALYLFARAVATGRATPKLIAQLDGYLGRGGTEILSDGRS